MDLRRLTHTEAHEIRTRARLHRINLKKIRDGPAAVDSRPPKTRMLPHIKRKREKQHAERSLRDKEIQRENVRIMERMTKILNEQHYKDAISEQRRASKTQRNARAKVRKMTLDAIERENAHLKRRLHQTQPVYKTKDWAEDRKVKERYLYTLSVYKRSPVPPGNGAAPPTYGRTAANLTQSNEDKPTVSPRSLRVHLSASPTSSSAQFMNMVPKAPPPRPKALLNTQLTSASAPSSPVLQQQNDAEWRESARQRLRTIVLHRVRPASTRDVALLEKDRNTRSIKRALHVGSHRFLARLRWGPSLPDIVVTLFDTRKQQTRSYRFAKRLLHPWFVDKYRNDPTEIMHQCLENLSLVEKLFEIHMPAPLSLQDIGNANRSPTQE